MFECRCADGSAETFLLTGELTFKTLPHALLVIEAITNCHSTLNFKGITVCDSAAIAFILATQRAALQKKHTVRIEALPPKLKGLMQVSNLNLQ